MKDANYVCTPLEIRTFKVEPDFKTPAKKSKKIKLYLKKGYAQTQTDG